MDDFLDLDVDTGEFDVDESELEKIMADRPACRPSEKNRKRNYGRKVEDYMGGAEGLDDEFATNNDDDQETVEDDEDEDDDLRRKKRSYERSTNSASENTVHGAFGIEPLLKKKASSSEDELAPLPGRYTPPPERSSFDDHPQNPSALSGGYPTNPNRAVFAMPTNPAEITALKVQLAGQALRPAQQFCRCSNTAKNVKPASVPTVQQIVFGHSVQLTLANPDQAIKLHDITALLQTFMKQSHARPLNFAVFSPRTANKTSIAPASKNGLLNINHQNRGKIPGIRSFNQVSTVAPLVVHQTKKSSVIQSREIMMVPRTVRSMGDGDLTIGGGPQSKTLVFDDLPTANRALFGFHKNPAAKTFFATHLSPRQTPSSSSFVDSLRGGPTVPFPVGKSAEVESDDDDFDDDYEDGRDDSESDSEVQIERNYPYPTSNWTRSVFVSQNSANEVRSSRYRDLDRPDEDSVKTATFARPKLPDTSKGGIFSRLS